MEGHAIVSADGMIAAGDGSMPKALRNEADWQSFQAALDRSVLVVVGRLGHERHPNPGRRRLVLTRSVETIAKDLSDPWATLWNPAGLEFRAVLADLDIAAGTIAVTGGTGTFDLFGPYYHRFVLAEVNDLVIPGGNPCFSSGHPRNVLSGLGLVPRYFKALDAAAGVTSTIWQSGPDND